jgi:hypothetical protein
LSKMSGISEILFSSWHVVFYRGLRLRMAMFSIYNQLFAWEYFYSLGYHSLSVWIWQHFSKGIKGADIYSLWRVTIPPVCKGQVNVDLGICER